MNSTPYSKEDSILKVSSVSIGLQSSELNTIKENLFSHALSFAQSIFGKFHFFSFLEGTSGLNIISLWFPDLCRMFYVVCRSLCFQYIPRVVLSHMLVSAMPVLR